MSNFITDIAFLLFVLLQTFSKVDSSRHCTYVYENGLVKHFSCGIYEFCCGSACCRSRMIGFYQMWYFWLMILLILLLCSGGGWWYRYGHLDGHRQHIPWPSPAVGGDGHQQTTMYHHTGGYTQPTAQYGAPPQCPNLPPEYAAQHMFARPNSGIHAFPPSDPPPPYTGPPPSYSSVVGNSSPSHHNYSNTVGNATATNQNGYANAAGNTAATNQNSYSNAVGNTVSNRSDTDNK